MYKDILNAMYYNYNLLLQPDSCGNSHRLDKVRKIRTL